MNRFIKLIIFWLLITALPVQGIAAATMGLCGHGTPFNPVTRMSATQVGLNAGKSEHHHHHHLLHHSESFDGSDASSGHHSIDHNQCKAGCCTGSFIAATTVATPRQQTTAGLRIVPIESRLFSRFIPDGLERPPRHFQI